MSGYERKLKVGYLFGTKITAGLEIYFGMFSIF